MRVTLSNVQFKSNYTKGQEEFKKLSKTEQACKLGVEKFRQNSNRPLSQPKGTVGEYIRRRVSVELALKKVFNKLK